MSEPAFYQTRAGRTFYEKSLPDLVKEIRRLAKAVEVLNERLESRASAEASTGTSA